MEDALAGLVATYVVVGDSPFGCEPPHAKDHPNETTIALQAPRRRMQSR